MPEVYASTEVTVELLDPVTGEALSTTILYRRDLTISERPVYAQRGYHRSSAVTAARLRSLGSITIRKDSEGLAASLAEEIKRWQKGVVFYALSSDLKGKRYKHPHLRITMTNADGTVDKVHAYNVKLSDRSLSAPDGGVVGDSISLDVLGGIDGPNEDRFEPVRGLSLHRTGSATYLSTAGTLTTATDSQARIGLPWVTRRNIMSASIFDVISGLWTSSNAATLAIAYPASLPAGAPSSIGEGQANACKITLTATAGNLEKSFSATAGETYTFSVRVYVPSSWTGQIYLWCGNGAYADMGTTTITERDQWVYKTVTFTLAATGTYKFLVGSKGAGEAADYFYVAEPQVEKASAATPYQPTHATGVDLTNPLNGAGLVCEGSGTNLITNNKWESGTAPWAPINCSLSRVTSLVSGKTYALQGAFSAQYGYFYIPVAWAASTKYIISFRGTVSTTQSIFVQDTATNTTIYSWSAKAGQTDDISFEYTTGVTPPTTLGFKCTAASSFGTCTVDIVQVEAGAFRTSPILTDGAAVTRNADLVGIVPPHNLLKYSQDYSQTVWTNVGITAAATTGPDGVGLAGSISLGTAGAGIRQDTSTAWGTATRTFAVWLKGAAGGEQVQLVLGRSDTGATVASSTVTLTTDWRRYYVTGTGAGAGNVWIRIARVTTSGTAYFGQMGLVEGSHPGPYVKTTDTAIPAPPSPALDPAWQQNGKLTFTIVPPSASTGRTYGLFGYDLDDSALCLWRHSSYAASNYTLTYERGHDGATGSASTAGRSHIDFTGAIYDGAPHEITMEWLNYTISGVRYMWQRVYVDGTLASERDVAATYGASTWDNLDPSRLVSDGNAYATISNLSFPAVMLPAGAIPAEG